MVIYEWAQVTALLLAGGFAGILAYIQLKRKVLQQTADDWKGMAEVKATKLQMLQKEFDDYKVATNARILKLEGALEALTNLKVPSAHIIAEEVWSHAPDRYAT